MRIPHFPTLALGATVVLGLGPPAAAQAPPATDLWLLAVEARGDRKPSFGEPERLTDRDGYDNQPAFLPDGSGLVYTSIRDGQADVWRLDLASRETRPITATPESEYSPTPIDGGDAVSVVRVEGDDRQRLWRFPLAGDGEPVLLLPDVEPVGYHAWSGDGGLLLFVLGEPPTLQWVPPGAAPETISPSPGRALHRVPGRDVLSFVDGAAPEGPTLSLFDPATGKVEPLIAMRDGSEDLAWDPEGRAWAADGARLLRYCPECGGGWRTMIHLGRYGLGKISRLAFSPDGSRLVFVAERGATPQDPAPAD